MTIEEMKARKIEMGLSNRELAARSGVPLGTVQRIFSGKTKTPRAAAIEGLERVLGKPVPGAAYSGRVYADDIMRADLMRKADMVKESSSGYGVEAVSAKKQGEYRLADYYAIPDDRRVELIDGVLYDMASPSNIHQKILMELAFQLNDYVKKNQGSCSVNTAPFDVQLDQDDRTMVQPDILVICNHDREHYFGCYGAPDLVVEILSPSTSKKDMTIKLHKYLDAGVREYWVVNPDSRQAAVYKNEDTVLAFRSYNFTENIPVGIWNDDCLVNLAILIEEIDYLESLKP